MTVSPDITPAEVTDMDGALALLRAHGHRVTAARRLVLAALFAADHPVSAEEIAGGSGGALPESDITSVYRNLETLEQLGVVRHVHLGHGPGRYRLTAARQRDYVVCEKCGGVETADAGDMEEIRALVRARLGYVVRFSHFPIVGLCPSCAGR